MAKIYVDSNAFIMAFELESTVSERLNSLFFRLPAGETPLLVTSVLSTAELLVKPLATNRDELVTVYNGWTRSSAYIYVAPISRDILVAAANTRARDRTQKLADAIHLATARMTTCTHLLTNDLRMRPDFDIAVVRLTENDVAGLIAELETDD